MKVTAYAMSVETFVPMLKGLAGVLDKAMQFAEARKLDASVLPNARLAPDMFALTLQVRIACMHAKDATAILTGNKPPEFDGTVTTLADLKARVEETIDFVSGAREDAFAGAEERDIVLPLAVNNLELATNAGRYLKDWALPHFYFHVVTAYDILRHDGVEIGKRDYMPHVGPYIRPRKG